MLKIKIILNIGGNLIPISLRMQKKKKQTMLVQICSIFNLAMLTAQKVYDLYSEMWFLVKMITTIQLTRAVLGG